MWRGLTHLFTHLAEVSALLREQNSLLRELILATSHRPAQTPLTKHSQSPPPPTVPRRYTADDVTVVTAAMRDQQAIDAVVAQQMPWRDPMETLADLDLRHEQAQKADQPVLPPPPRPLTPPV